MLYRGNARNGTQRPDSDWMSVLALVYLIAAAIAAGN